MSIDIVETFPVPVGVNEINDLHFKKLGDIENHPLVGNNIHIQPGVIEFKEVFISNRIIFEPGFSYNGTIYFNNCYFSKDQPVNDISIKRIVYNNCVFFNAISIGGDCKVGTWELKSNKCKRIDVDGGEIESLEISNNYIERIYIRGGVINRISITASTNYLATENNFYIIENLGISFSELKSSISITSNHVKNISLDGHINKETSLFLNYVSFVNIQLFNITNEGRLVFSNLNLIDFFDANLPFSPKEDRSSLGIVQRPEFSISQCNLGKAEFYNIDFTRINDLEIHNSFIMDCLFVNIIWPQRLNLSDAYNYKNLYDARSQREVYRQIKIALSKQGDSIGEHKFHALEMNTLYYALEWKRYFWTKLIIRLSYITSNYGQSFYRPLLSILIINFPLFYNLVQMGKVSTIYIPQYDLATSERLVIWASEFIKFCNPLHKLDVELLGWSFIIDTLIRIVSSYGIYNIIRATRRFVK